MKRTGAVRAINALLKCAVLWPIKVRLRRCPRRLLADLGAGPVASRARASISIGAWATVFLLLGAAAAATACGGTSGGGEATPKQARELASTLAEQLRAYRDSGLDADLRSAQATCEDIRSDSTGIQYSVAQYAKVLVSACETLDLLDEDPRLNVQSAISMVELALELIE